MKFSKLLVIVFLLLFVLAGCSKEGKFSENKQYYTEINDVKDFIAKYNAKDVYTIVISQTTCGHCIEYKKILNRVVFDEKINIYVLEYNTLSKSDQKKIEELDKRFEKFGTPLTIFTQSGEIIDEIVGNLGEELLLNRLKYHNLVK